MFLLGLAVFLEHGFDFRGDAALGVAGEGRVVVQARVDQPLVSVGQSGEARDQIAIIEVAIGAGGFGEGKRQSHEQVLALVHELVGKFHLQKQCRRVELVRWTRLFVLSRLDQVGAVARTVEGDLPLLAAALRANPPMHGGAEALLLADVTDDAGQNRSS